MIPPKLSVIIPLYNAKPFLRKCLDSILVQSFQDVEILLINDGSDDSSEKICNQYAEKYDHISVFHQVNAGPSAARNKGLQKAQGRFVTFIDADDEIEKDYLEGFFTVDPNPENAVVLQGIIRENKAGKKLQKTLKNRVFSRNAFGETFEKLDLIRKWPFMAGKMYDLAILKKYSLRFKTTIRYGEDLIFFLDYIRYTQKIVTSSHSYYHYNFNPVSLTYSLYRFESEIERLRTVNKQEAYLSKVFFFSAELQRNHRLHFSTYFHRALHSLYLPPYKKARRERIKILKEFHQNGESLYFKEGSWSKARIFRITAYLIDRKQYTMADFLLLYWHIHRSPYYSSQKRPRD